MYAYDVIIIGGGPAGLTAALYASRRSLSTLVISKDIGGQASKTFGIENYPGISKISGVELATTMKKQAESFGAKMIFEEAKKITRVKKDFCVKTSSNTYEAKTLIIASGKKPRELDVPGEEQFKGRGVTYCATCDAPFFKNKTVAVVGGGNSALDAALLSSTIANKVYLIHRKSSFTGEDVLIDKVRQSKNIEVIFDSIITEIKGENVVKSIMINGEEEIAVDGLIVEVGFVVDHALIENLVKLNEQNQIIVDSNQRTSVPGIFAAGDITTTQYKQIVISTGEGAKAALAAFDYIQHQKGKRGIIADWQHHKN